MADGSTKSIDELLEQARKIKAQAGQAGTDAKKTDIKGSVVGDALKNVEAFNQTAKEVNGGVALIKESSKSVWNFIARSWFGRGYMWLFNKICYKKDKETGEKKLVKGRRNAMVLATAFLATAVIPGAIGTPARTTIGAVTEPVYDGVRMATMMERNVPIYLNDEHVADHDHNLWIVKGTTLPNSRGETVILKVKPSLAHDIWNQAHHGSPFFIPDQVVAPVAPGNTTQYMVTYYGVRWRIATWLQAYPELLDVRAVSPTFNPETNPYEPSLLTRTEHAISGLFSHSSAPATPASQAPQAPAAPATQTPAPPAPSR